jgi:hypothetical protein
VAKVPKRTPEEIEAQQRRLKEFRAMLEKRLERDRELREAARRQEP